MSVGFERLSMKQPWILCIILAHIFETRWGHLKSVSSIPPHSFSVFQGSLKVYNNQLLPALILVNHSCQTFFWCTSVSCPLDNQEPTRTAELYLQQIPKSKSRFCKLRRKSFRYFAFTWKRYLPWHFDEMERSVARPAQAASRQKHGRRGEMVMDLGLPSEETAVRDHWRNSNLIWWDF